MNDLLLFLQSRGSANVCTICEKKYANFRYVFRSFFLTFVASNINYNIFKSL